jgi:hypothetical protein
MSSKQTLKVTRKIGKLFLSNYELKQLYFTGNILITATVLAA